MDQATRDLEESLADLLHIDEGDDPRTTDITTAEEFSQWIMTQLTPGALEEESLPIIDKLIKINQLGLTTFESQPYQVKLHLYGRGKSILRAYINGMLPKEAVRELAHRLIELNSNIVVSETVLMPKEKNDYLILYNFKDIKTPLAGHLYPMLFIENERGVSWLDGYSGHVTRPMMREYIDDHFFELGNELVEDIVDNYSLIEIWSQELSDELFSTVIKALQSL